MATKIERLEKENKALSITRERQYETIERQDKTITKLQVKLHSRSVRYVFTVFPLTAVFITILLIVGVLLDRGEAEEPSTPLRIKPLLYSFDITIDGREEPLHVHAHEVDIQDAGRRLAFSTDDVRIATVKDWTSVVRRAYCGEGISITAASSGHIFLDITPSDIVFNDDGISMFKE